MISHCKRDRGYGKQEENTIFGAMKIIHMNKQLIQKFVEVEKTISSEKGRHFLCVLCAFSVSSVVK